MHVCSTKSEPSSISGKAVALFATSASIVKLAGKKASNTVGAPRIPGDRTASASNALRRREARVKEICRKSSDNWTMWHSGRTLELPLLVRPAVFFFFFFICLGEQFFAASRPFSRGGNFGLPGTWSAYRYSPGSTGNKLRRKSPATHLQYS